jgi:transcriptional regulator
MQADETTLKKGTAELLILAQLENRPSHGYEIAQQIDIRSGGAVSFHVASLYPILYRLERRNLIAGRWVEKAGQRRRRYYTLTAAGRRVLAEQRRNWSAFMQAVQAAAGLGHA